MPQESSATRVKPQTWHVEMFKVKELVRDKNFLGVYFGIRHYLLWHGNLSRESKIGGQNL